ncbi:hypothetical protein E2C01_024283 [Portunus trituberculatus]|uniref:Uncharacterized protein n=1 Tax=Portunus trituberculatus TaxID=210409 RepID=A0A5B7ECF4_PORTR|nr:hypothetical protein [Portunus trituberculatus]
MRPGFGYLSPTLPPSQRPACYSSHDPRQCFTLMHFVACEEEGITRCPSHSRVWSFGTPDAEQVRGGAHGTDARYESASYYRPGGRNRGVLLDAESVTAQNESIKLLAAAVAQLPLKRNELVIRFSTSVATYLVA